MKKTIQILILLVIFLAGNVVVSAPVSVETAKTVAANFVRSMDSGDPSSLSLIYKGENIYVFDDCRSFRIPSLGSGWVIVSADDRAYPILGYSNEGWFLDQTEDTIVANNFWGWMKQIEKEINYAIENNLSASAEITQMWQELRENYFTTARNDGNNGSDGTTAVEPLLTTTWGQGFPYNAMCPAGAVTGCVATAMGQILKYWNYPEQGLGSYGYTWEGYPYTYADFGNTTYNWANMPNSISEENADIAKLLYHTAVSCRSMWGSNTGVAVTSNDNPMVASFWNYFRMAFSSLRYVQKVDMPTTWESIIQNELTAGRPVYYRGDGVGSHAWVCDGVDANGMYHFNWGWDGMYNGYFVLTAIMPGNYNFTNNQAAIIGIQPNDGSTLVENTNWNGTITKATSIAVPDAITLTVNPGTEVKFAQGAKLQICGQLTSIGEADNYVKFTATDTISGWEGIDWDEDYLQRMADNDSSRLIYTQIQWSKSSGIYTYQYGKINIDHCKVNNNDAGIWNGTTNQTGGYGGGISVWNNSINIFHSEIYNNHATISGGGIFITTDNVATSIYQNNIYDNMSDIDGGGVYLSNLNYTVFENNIVHHNQAVKGAGAMLTSGSPMIVNNKFCNNITPSPGFGCFHLENCNAKIVNNLIANNTANGIFCENSSPVVLNTIIINNNHDASSGMIFVGNSNANVKNCIIYGNLDNYTGYGNNIGLYSNNSDPYFDHCDIQGGLEGFGGPGGGTNYNSANYTNNIDADPLFVDPSGGAGSGYNGLEADWSLQSQSPCIDAGDTTGVSQYLPPFDLGGNPRINGTIDMGAYEYCAPSQPSAINGDTSPCRWSTQTYSVINVTGVVYDWTIPEGWLINSGQGTNQLTVVVFSNFGGTISVTPSNDCGTGPAQSLQLTVDYVNANAGPDQTLEYGETITLSGNANNGSGDYTWHWEPASLLINPDVQNPTTLALTETTTFTLYVTDQVTGCQGEDEVIITIQGYIPVAVEVGALPDTICNGESSSLICFTSGGTGEYTYTWSSDPAGFSSNEANPTVYPEITTTYTVEVTDGISTASASVVVTVNNVPAQANQPMGPDNVDLYYNSTSLYSTEPVANADYYNWVLEPANMGTVSGNGNEITITWSGVLGQANLQVKAVNDCGDGEWSQPLIIQVDNSVGGISQIEVSDLNIYPNPCNGKFTISCDQNISAVYLQDVSGRMLNPQSFGQLLYKGAKVMDCDNLPKGLYFVHVCMGSQRTVRKVMIVE